ncbi:MAG: hypothetical protein IKH61_06725 [Bacteroidales bacterium]|nr:hypothetical protein [Bacteroidales bacterium]
MIDLVTKIHDKFTLEFKVGFNTHQEEHPMKYSDFVMNTWIFVPNSLDINAAKYSKEDFYRDLKSGVRLITPSYGLHELATDEELLPSKSLITNFNDLHIAPDDTQDLIHSIRMYCAISKSAFRDECLAISQQHDATQRMAACSQFLLDGGKILNRFRGLLNQLNDQNATDRTRQVFAYGDEFLSNVMEKYAYRLRDIFRHNHPDEYQQLEARFKEVLYAERAYREKQGYLCVKADDAKGNEDFVFRASLLKKFSESDLYLNATKRKNTFLVEQILYSLAAGAAMVVATLSSFFFQQKYGNFTLPFLIALVISYMFKDRLKDWLRLIFARRVSNKVFDTRTDFRIKGRYIGWSKDSVDFIDSDKILPEVMELRSRNPLFTEVSGKDEKVLLYRKKVQLWPAELAKASPYPLRGINDILRYNITEYTRKMDNPSFPLSGTWEDNGYKPIEGKKVYHLTFVIQCVYEGKTEYKRIVVRCDKKGIVNVKVS